MSLKLHKAINNKTQSLK